MLTRIRFCRAGAMVRSIYLSRQPEFLRDLSARFHHWPPRPVRRMVDATGETFEASRRARRDQIGCQIARRPAPPRTNGPACRTLRRDAPSVSNVNGRLRSNPGGRCRRGSRAVAGEPARVTAGQQLAECREVELAVREVANRHNGTERGSPRRCTRRARQ